MTTTTLRLVTDDDPRTRARVDSRRALALRARDAHEDLVVVTRDADELAAVLVTIGARPAFDPADVVAALDPWWARGVHVAVRHDTDGGTRVAVGLPNRDPAVLAALWLALQADAGAPEVERAEHPATLVATWH